MRGDEDSFTERWTVKDKQSGENVKKKGKKNEKRKTGNKERNKEKYEKRKIKRKTTVTSSS